MLNRMAIIAALVGGAIVGATAPQTTTAAECTCEYNGKTYQKNDIVCWSGKEMKCGCGGWSKTGNSCKG